MPLNPLRTFAVATASCVAAAAVAAPVLDRSQVRFRELPNGLRVIVKENPDEALVNVALYIKAGSLTEGGYQAGISRFVQRLVFEGTTDGATADLRAELEALGGAIGSTVTRDFTFASIAVAPPYLDAALGTLAKAVRERTFTAQEIQEQRHDLTTELRRLRQPQHIELRLDRALWQLAFQKHPYRLPIHGTIESLDATTQSMIRDYVATFYVPNNMSLLIVGQVKADDAFAAAEKAFGDLKRRPLDWKEPEPEPEQTKPRIQDRPIPAERAALKVAFHAPGIARKRDVCAMDIIYTILGQGGSSRLRKVLQDEKKLIVASDVEFITRRAGGLFIVTLVYESSNELKVRTALMEELQRFSEDPLSDQELAAAKKLLRDAYALSNETNEDQTGSMGFYDAIDTYEFAIDYVGEVNKITADDIIEVAKRYFRPDAYILLRTRPSQQSPVKEAREPDHAQGST